jgi:hypothetical protein
VSANSGTTGGSERASSRPGGGTHDSRARAHVPVYVVVAIGLVALTLGTVVLLTDSEQRLAGTNGVPASIFVRVVDPGAKYCQPGQVVPSDASTVGILVGNYGHPRPRLIGTLVLGSAEVGKGILEGGRRQGEVRIALSHRRPGRYVATFCLRNAGGTPLALAGSPQPGSPVRLAWYRSGSETWLTLLPRTLKRFSLGRGASRASWAAPLAVLLVLSAITTAIAVVVKTAA